MELLASDAANAGAMVLSSLALLRFWAREGC
jgi:hypothetical protein